MSWFDDEKAKIRKSHINNLITLALIDGNLDKTEQDLLYNVASQWGITPKEFQYILKNPKKVKFNPPTTKDERVHQMLDLIYMMMIDGKIQEREMDLVKTLAPSLGFPPSAVDKTVNYIIDGINQHMKRDFIAQQIAAMN